MRSASLGVTSVDYLQKNKPVLLDLCGGYDGRLKENNPSIVTVLMTGWDIGEEDPKVAGFDLWTRKPFKNLDAVRDVLARALDLRERREASPAVASNSPHLV